MQSEKFEIEVEQETDGRWIAEISKLPGVMAYGQNKDAAVAKVEAIALRVLADRMEATFIGTSQISVALT